MASAVFAIANSRRWWRPSLIGLGHPVGATGVRMVLDAARQSSGQAGEMQIEGARTVGTYNVGGSGTANVAFIVGFPSHDSTRSKASQ